MKCFVYFDGQQIEANIGENLRSALLRHNCSPHNAKSFISCQGLGSCGTCAIEVVDGDAGVVTHMERWRLRFPPHKDGPNPMRLACQVTVAEDLKIRKHMGFWGAPYKERPYGENL